MSNPNNDGWGSGGSWPTGPTQGWPEPAKKAIEIVGQTLVDLIPEIYNTIVPIHTTLKMYNGEVVEAIIVGDLAIWETEEEGWSICHVPTLTDVMSCVPFVEDAVYTNDELIRWCQVAQSSNQEDWLALKSLTRENYQDKPELIEVKQRIRKLCLNTQLNEWKE